MVAAGFAPKDNVFLDLRCEIPCFLTGNLFRRQGSANNSTQGGYRHDAPTNTRVSGRRQSLRFADPAWGARRFGSRGGESPG